LRDGSEWLPNELSIDHNTRVVARESVIREQPGCSSACVYLPTMARRALTICSVPGCPHGHLRADCEAQDIAILQLMLGLVIGATQDVEPELWRRYLGIVLQGLRANPDPPAPLAPPAVSLERTDEVMVASWNARRRG
jgi:hypothetical protein